MITALRECRQVDQKFKVLVSYIVNSRPSWVIDPVGENRRKQERAGGKRREEKRQGARDGGDCQVSRMGLATGKSVIHGNWDFLFYKVKTPPPSQTWLWLPSTMDTPEANVTYLEKVMEIRFMIWGAMAKNKTLKRTCVLRNHFALCQKHSVPACLSLAGFPGWLSWQLHGSATPTLHLPPFLCVLQSRALSLLSGCGHCLTPPSSPSISSLLENAVLPERPGPTAAHACSTNRENTAVLMQTSISQSEESRGKKRKPSEIL